MEHVRPDGQREVFAVICLVDYNPRREDPMRRFGYKDMDETVSPIESECPALVLDLLTATEFENALDWRARCRARIDKRKASVKPKHGDSIHFAEAISFENGSVKLTDFTFYIRPSKQSVYFAAPGRSTIYSIRNWQDRPHTITPALGLGAALSKPSTQKR